MQDQHRHVDCLAIRLRVQRGVAVEVGFQTGRAGEAQFDAFGFGPRPDGIILPRKPGTSVSRSSTACAWGFAASTADLVSLILAMMTPRKDPDSKGRIGVRWSEDKKTPGGKTSRRFFMDQAQVAERLRPR
ncbi:hypothetical protein U724_05950 [Pseudomonas chlororaphis subsp. aurantiaca PB-St2]|nr:hypothetical protein U724_05950 [Pseudomonas chlororaphis subsp. aurantiaca PB-St2]